MMIQAMHEAATRPDYLSAGKRLEMKKWKIAQRKLAWQVTGDRNIGGHTARIPDGINFLANKGPRGVGIDLSNKDTINRLAQSIVPPTTVSKRSQLYQKLENKWVQHHGAPNNANSQQIRSNHNRDPVRQLFGGSNIKNESIKELIEQLKMAANSGDSPLGQISESSGTDSGTGSTEDVQKTKRRTVAEAHVAKDGKPARAGEGGPAKSGKVKTAGRVTKSGKLMTLGDQGSAKTGKRAGSSAGGKGRGAGQDNRDEHSPDDGISVNMSDEKSDSEPDLSESNDPTQSNKREEPKNSRSAGMKWSMAATKATNQSSTSQEQTNQKKQESKKSTASISRPASRQSVRRKATPPSLAALMGKGRKSATPASGFNSANNFGGLLGKVIAENNRTQNNELKFGKAMTDLLTSSKLTGLLKKAKASENIGGGGQGAQALISILQEVDQANELRLYKFNPKFKKAYQVSGVLSQLTGNRFIMPMTDNYDVPDANKDGQSFTRRRTRGMMYDTLEPISFSDVYARTNSPTKLKPLLMVGGHH